MSKHFINLMLWLSLIVSVTPTLGQQTKVTEATKATSLLKAQLEETEYLTFINIPEMVTYLQQEQM